MGHGRVRVDLAAPAQRELGLQRFVPVKRPIPLPLSDCGPAIRQPQQRVSVGARSYELAVLAVGYRSYADSVWVQECIVRRQFVVETERVAVMPDAHDAVRPLRELIAAGVHARRTDQAGMRGRFAGSVCEHMLDVREDQLLVLLFVVQSQYQHVELLVVQATRIQHTRHLFVNRVAICEDLTVVRALDLPALGPRVHVARRVVVGIEQVVILVVEPLHPAGLENEALEEPGDVRQVPLGRADIGHGLQARMLRAQLAHDVEAQGPHAFVVLFDQRSGSSVFRCTVRMPKLELTRATPGRRVR